MLTEAVLGVQLARVVEQHSPGRWLAGDTIGYARTGGGGEIDLVPIPLPGPAGTEATPPLEVRWVSSGWRAAARSIRARYGRGIVATKTVTDCNGPVWALPAPVVSLLLA